MTQAELEAIHDKKWRAIIDRDRLASENRLLTETVQKLRAQLSEALARQDNPARHAA